MERLTVDFTLLTKLAAQAQLASSPYYGAPGAIESVEDRNYSSPRLWLW